MTSHHNSTTNVHKSVVVLTAISVIVLFTRRMMVIMGAKVSPDYLVGTK